MVNNNKIIKLKIDIIFKALFGNKNNEELLKSFLASILEIPRSSIKEIITENVELIPENYKDKFSRVDLKMKVDDKMVNVEMQVKKEEDFKDRTLYYWSRIYGSQLKGGEEYKELKETICINIIDFNLFDCKDYHSHFKIMENNRHEVLSDKFSIHFFELRKIDMHPDKSNLMKLWLQLINAETEEEVNMIENTNVKEINDAIVALREISSDERMRYMAEMREKALHDEVSALNSAERKGRKEGILIGEAKGRKEGREEGILIGESKVKIALIEKMRKKGMSEDDIKALIDD